MVRHSNIRTVQTICCATSDIHSVQRCMFVCDVYENSGEGYDKSGRSDALLNVPHLMYTECTLKVKYH